MDNVPEPMKPFFKTPIAEVGNAELQWMLQRFVLEVRNEKGGNYPLDTLYELCTSLQKDVNKPRQPCCFVLLILRVSDAQGCAR